MNTPTTLFLIVVSILMVVTSLKCKIGYGQRGLMYQNEISWTRTCPDAEYCFEAVTTDIAIMRRLFEYPWVRLLIIDHVLS